jgi:uncharacterized phage-associated protein
MATVLDVASYILDKQKSMTAMKLEKLVYYAKAWHLVWESESLFPERTEAWANGPVVPELYREHRGRFSIDAGTFGAGNPKALTIPERGSIDAVLAYYGGMTPYQLSELTHRERPWREARGSTSPGERSNAVISEDVMYEYYDGLVGLGEEG